jgi:lipopolysaccharide export LptBFGC system permease protein LptF
MGPSFHHADRQTYRRIAIVGALFCLAFVAISFSLRPRRLGKPVS